MTILSDKSILDLVKRGEIIIEPFDEAKLTPNGYDLTIQEVEIPGNDKISRGDIVIPPGERFAVSTKETISCGERNIVHNYGFGPVGLVKE